MNEWPRAATWLYEQLTTPLITDIEDRVSEHPAAQGATFPLITFQDTAPADVTVVGEDRVWAEFLVLVTAIAEGESYDPIADAADAIDARLHGAEFGAAGVDAMVISSVRERPFSLPVLEEGKSYRRLGGYYRLLVQPLSP